MTIPIWLRFLSGPDVDALATGPDEVIAAVESVVGAHGRGQTVFEPRTHLVPDNGGAGHFNVLRGHVGPLGEHGRSGVKVSVTSSAAASRAGSARTSGSCSGTAACRSWTSRWPT